MRISNLLALALSTASLWGITPLSTQAIERADGSVAFEKPPRLEDVITTFNDAGVWGAKYYFTLTLPEDAGEPLGKITINQRQGMENIKFRLDETFAFLGTPRDKGEQLTVQEVTRDSQTRTVSVTFDPPIAPGQTFTVGLKPRYNPRFGGVYLFGVTTFPAAQKPYSLYIGVGRLHFYNDGHDIFF